MLSPILHFIPNFDANDTIIVKFDYTEKQVFANQLTIKDNITLAVVYEQKISTMQLSHSIPMNTLVNGKTYEATVKVFDKDDNASPSSTPVRFTCYTTPTFIISNIHSNDTINSATLSVILEYVQQENILLDHYEVNLYDYGHKLINTSGILYDTRNLNVQFNNLKDNESYYIQAIGETVGNVVVKTDLIGFHVDLIQPNAFLQLQLENVAEESSIKISSHIVMVEGRSEGNIRYNDANTAINLLNGGKVIFDNGFNIDDNFTIDSAWSNLQVNESFLHMFNGINDIELTWHQGDFGQGEEYYVELIATTKITNDFSLKYVIQSNNITLSNTNNIIRVLIQKQANVFNLIINNLGGELYDVQ